MTETPNPRPDTAQQPGKLFAACGHEVPDPDALVNIRFGDTDCDHNGFRRVIVYGAWCQACADRWRASGDLIETDEQEEAWLAGDCK